MERGHSRARTLSRSDGLGPGGVCLRRPAVGPQRDVGLELRDVRHGERAALDEKDTVTRTGAGRKGAQGVEVFLDVTTARAGERTSPSRSPYVRLEIGSSGGGAGGGPMR
jgi:hypothetical protein